MEPLSLLEQHMDDSSPYECVGLLLWDGNTIRLRNQAQSEHRYFVSGAQLQERVSPDDPIMAIYHSHPQRESTPSGEDKEMMRMLLDYWPTVFHIILSPHGHRAYHVVDDAILERNLPW